MCVFVYIYHENGGKVRETGLMGGGGYGQHEIYTCMKMSLCKTV